MNESETKLAKAIVVILVIIFLTLTILFYFVPSAMGQLSGEYEDEGCELVELYGSRTYVEIRMLLIHDPGISSFNVIDTDNDDTVVDFRERENVMEIETNSTDRIVMRYDIEYHDKDPNIIHPFEVRLESQNDIVSQERTHHIAQDGTYCRIISMTTSIAPQPETLEDLLGKDTVTALIELSEISNDIDQILQALAFGTLTDTGIIFGILLMVAGVIVITYFGRNEFKELQESLEKEITDQTEFNLDSKTIIDEVINKGDDAEEERNKKFEIFLKKGDDMVNNITKTIEGAFQMHQKLTSERPERLITDESKKGDLGHAVFEGGKKETTKKNEPKYTNDKEKKNLSRKIINKISESIPKKKSKEEKKDTPENLTENYWMIFFDSKKYNHKTLRKLYNDNRSLYMQNKSKNHEALVKSKAIIRLLKGEEPE